MSAIARSLPDRPRQLGRPGGAWSGPADRESVIVPGASDAAFAYDDQVVAVGDRAFRSLAAESNVVGGRLVLTLAFAMRDRDLTVGRHYAIGPGAPVVEMWTSVHGTEETTLRNLEGLRLETTARDAWWHRGHDTGDEEGGPFTRHTSRFDHALIRFRQPRASSQESLPWFGLNAGEDRLVVGLAWSGGWRADVKGTAVGTRVQIGLRDMSVRVGAEHEVEFPHAFVGVTDATPGAESGARRVAGTAQRPAVSGAGHLQHLVPVRHLSTTGSRANRSTGSRRWAASSSSSTPAGTRR